MNDRHFWRKIPFLLTTGALLFQILAICILGAVPPVSRDALTHHLALPKIYLEKGFSTELPYIPFSYSPMNIDLLYMLPLSLNNDVATKYIHFAFGLLTALTIYLLLSRWIGRLFGLLGAYLFLSLPVIVKLSITAYVDLGLAFFSMAALYAVIKWIGDNLRLRYLCAAAICCGLALGTKYNALLVLCIMTLSIPVVGINFRRMQSHEIPPSHELRTRKKTTFIGPTILFCLIAVMLYAPWGLRNLRWTGNPIYPLYHSVIGNIHLLLGDQASKSDHDRIRELYDPQINRNHLLIRRVVYKESPWQIALIPLRIFFQGKDDDPRYFDGRLHPLLFFCPFLIFINLKRENAAMRLGKLYLLGFAWLYILMAALSTDMRVRYLAPAIPPLVVLSICGLHSLLVFVKTRFEIRYAITAGTIALLAIVMVPNVFYVRGLFQRYTPLEYLTGRIDRDQYIENFRTEYPVLQYVNAHLPQEVKILSIFGGNRRYYCDRDLFFNNELFKSLLVKQPGAIEIIQKLKQHGFTHIVVNHPFFDQWMYPGLTEDQRQSAGALFGTQLKLLFEKNGHALYRI